MLTFSLTKKVRRIYQPKRQELKRWLMAGLLSNYINIYIDISIVSSIESAELNKRYRKRNSATNVISLEYAEQRDKFAILTGELILCDDVIVREAAEQNKSIIEHYAHMVIHGILHLQGYDHIIEKEALYMEQLEVEILTSLGFNSFLGLINQ